MISILLPTYNGERFIEESVKSVLNQSIKNFELLIGINGSKDSTKNILSSINDDRLKIFDYGEEPLGVSNTLNLLLKESTYDHIAIQDDDDIWMSEKLERQFLFLNDYDVIGSQILYIDEDGKTPTVYGAGPKLETTNEIIQHLTKTGQNQVANSSSIIKKSKIVENNGWDGEYPGYEDMDMWLKLMSNGCSFINLDEILVCHRVYNESRFNSKEWDIGNLLKKYN
jgi:glycosyltransferase involved in cell wall biosynthesis